MKEYPEDRLYLRVKNLLTEIKDYYSLKPDYYTKVQFYNSCVYIRTIERKVNGSINDIDFIKRTEEHLLGKGFLNQNCFLDEDKELLRAIIRNYKLNMLV